MSQVPADVGDTCTQWLYVFASITVVFLAPKIF